MGIEITNKPPLPEINSRLSSNTAQPNTDNSSPLTVQKNDSVSLSIDAAFTAIKQTPSVNAERIQELKLAIEDGSYQVDSQTIAKNMIQMEQELITL